ncbi:unnamed protein product [Camellia sinensis]
MNNDSLYLLHSPLLQLLQPPPLDLLRDPNKLLRLKPHQTTLGSPLFVYPAPISSKLNTDTDHHRKERKSPLKLPLAQERTKGEPKQL